MVLTEYLYFSKSFGPLQVNWEVAFMKVKFYGIGYLFL